MFPVLKINIFYKQVKLKKVNSALPAITFSKKINRTSQVLSLVKI